MRRYPVLLLLAACTGVKDDTATETPCTTLDWVRDADGDSFGDDASTLAACEAPEGYVSAGGDCDDADPLAFPGAPELCGEVGTGTDEDCDGLLDDADPDVTGRTVAWRDDDQDTHGDPDVQVEVCTLPEGYVLNADDCDDDNPAAYPGATEVCDEADNNCDGLVDDDDPLRVDPPTWFRDADQDTYGDPADTVAACISPEGYVARGGDCDDTTTAISPVVPEVCNGTDDDCDELVDDADPEVLGQQVWYPDLDGDDHGDPASFLVACFEPDGYADEATDCDDARSDVHPGADEVCDDADNDCDLLVDDEDDVWNTSTGVEGHPDADEDGYGASSLTEVHCDLPEGWTLDGSDCADRLPEWHPGAWDRCGDGADPDCDGADPTCDSVGDGLASITGAHGGDLAGAVLTSVGDFNADGAEDFAVAAFQDEVLGVPNVGLVGVYFGPLAGDVSLLDAQVRITGDAAEDTFGFAIAGADLDGDGRGDLLAGAPGLDWAGGAGGAALFRGGGRIGATAYADADEHFVGAAPGDLFGAAVALPGDLDGDTAGDLVVSAPAHGDTYAASGAVYVWGSIPPGLPSAGDVADQLYAEADHERLGSTLFAPGDLDGDGLADLVVSTAPDASPARVYVVVGPVVGLTPISAHPAWDSEASGGDAGAALGSAGDYDGDGLPDLVVGDILASDRRAEEGAAYVLSGSSCAGGSLGKAPLVLRGDAENERAGSSATGLDDLDGDGLPELLVGAFGEGTSAERAGAVYLVPGGLSGSHHLGDLARVYTGVAENDNAGSALLALSDQDGDGLADWLVGAPARSGPGLVGGSAWLVAGAP